MYELFNYEVQIQKYKNDECLWSLNRGNKINLRINNTFYDSSDLQRNKTIPKLLSDIIWVFENITEFSLSNLVILGF